MLTRMLVAGAALAAGGALAAGAAADGLPVLGVDVGTQGVAVAAAPLRYVTLRVAGQTVVEQTAEGDGHIVRYRRVAGSFTVPAVAYDGSASGLSANGSTLVLIQPRRAFPRARTAFAVLDARVLRLRRVVSLRGDFSFDAVSADGRTMFLIQYVSVVDPTLYNVRAYDLRTWRLLPRRIVDPTEPGTMRGSPLSRTTSGDGRWAYTLYDGGGSTPFLHALDTKRRTARCIDLPMLRGRHDLWQLRLGVAAGGRTVVVRGGARRVALVDAVSFRASRVSK